MARGPTRRLIVAQQQSPDIDHEFGWTHDCVQIGAPLDLGLIPPTLSPSRHRVSKALRLTPDAADESVVRPKACDASCLWMVRSLIQLIFDIVQGGDMQRTIRRTGPLVVAVTMLGLMSGTLGCAFGEIYWTDPLKREYTLGETQKRYTNLVRFGAFVQASQFVDPELSQAFLDNFPSRVDLIFTDFEAERIDFNEDGKRDAVVRVTYSAYYTHSPIVFEIVETQNWYREGAMNTWRVRPNFAGLEKFAAAN